jgi:hypothetical protein
MSEPESIESHERRKTAAKQWIEATFTDWYAIYPERVGPKTPLFSTPFRGSLYTLLLDGYAPARPEWANSRPPSVVLLSALSALLEQRSACWALLNCHDDAYWEVFDVWGAHPGKYVSFALLQLQSHPADQGGSSCLVLLFDDHDSIITFDHSSQSFDVVFYGSDSRRDEFLELLQSRVETTPMA